MLTDFYKVFAGRLITKFAIKLLLNIPPHLNRIATLPIVKSPCSEIVMLNDWIYQCKNFENRLAFGEVTDKSLVYCFFGSQCILQRQITLNSLQTLRSVFIIIIIIHFISGNVAHKNTNKQKQKRTIHTYTHNTREHREDRNTKHNYWYISTSLQ